MRRIDLPEIEDWAGCPRWIRDAMTGYLQVALEMGRPYHGVVPRLAELLRESGTSRVLDLASGGGGPWFSLRDALLREGVEAEVTLTDLAPNRDAAGRFQEVAGVGYHREPVSALAIPSS
jgi:hypothetical protein